MFLYIRNYNEYMYSKSHSDRFRHIQAYPGIIQAYIGKPCVTLVYLEPWSIQNHEVFRARSICRALAYSQPYYIQSPRTFRTLPYSKSEAYSELCQIYTMKHFAKTVNGYNCFCKLKLLTQYKLVMFSSS